MSYQIFLVFTAFKGHPMQMENLHICKIKGFTIILLESFGSK